ncbi:MAG TPA: FAD-binding domain-containing protein, partial [Candidatus Acidoferrales bacterium]|nr:FAD-binding domain-containing protein [Candidatus Acidoferrales bacterium]
EPGTSRISHALKLGTLSARSCLDAVRRAVQRRPEAAKAAQKWIDELLWREFFYHILWHFPHVATSAFKSQFDRVAWRDDPQDFARWQRGETGYPIVDAGMRQLRDTAWMHNRARMIVAMFLTKDLLIDWRQGERHFMRFLADGDLASNNGGWQWCAGSGADGAPYFRIFNPTTQAIRFDPAGVYVRRYLPELAKLPDAWIHEPWRAPAHVLAEAKVTLGKTYPRPIVDHASARIRALAAYGAIRKSLE